MTRGRTGVQGNRRDEGARHAELIELAAELKPFLGTACGEGHFVTRNTGAADVLFKEPFHGTAAFQVHSWSHNRFHFVLKLIGGEGFLRVLGDESVKERGEACVGVSRVRLAKHLAEHVKDPGAFGINHNVISFGRFRRSEAGADGDRTNISRSEVGIQGFGKQALAVAGEPSEQSVIGAFLRVGEEQREINGEALVNPLVAITGPADNVAPPLMGNLVSGNDIGKGFLGSGVDAQALLDLRRKEGIRGEIKKARPTLPERARNLRNGEAVKREGTAKPFKESDRGVHFAGE